LHIPEIIEQIKILIKKGYAYETRNGVYFDESQFPDYGKLSKRKIEDLTVSRIKSDLNKINPGDFALWKIKDDPPTWKSPWGKGRPGWHIEDTAITEEYFGPQYDIHGGGLDLIFPHHEAEIAQMESISGFKPMVRYWMHTGFLNVDGEKMSKSLGNFITIKKLLQEYDPQSFRFFVLSTHYRSPIDFNDKILKQAHKSIMRMKKFIHRLSELDLEEYGEDDNILINDVDKTREKFMDAMNDDFNTPLAISIIFDFIRNFNKVLDRDLMSNHTLNHVQKVIIEFGEILGLKLTPEDDEDHKDEKLIEIITDVRQKLRDKSEWDLADDIRDQLRKIDITLEDS
jgi:cysteinyl-tRNA synthetase